MQPAFLFLVRFPPPAARALGLARRDRARAWRAGDRGEPLGVPGIDGGLVRDRERPPPLARPVEQGAELEQAARIARHHVDVAAVAGLVGAQADDPRRGSRQGAVERLDLAHVAAGGARRARIVEAVDAVRADQLFEWLALAAACRE